MVLRLAAKMSALCAVVVLATIAHAQETKKVTDSAEG